MNICIILCISWYLINFYNLIKIFLYILDNVILPLQKYNHFNFKKHLNFKEMLIKNSLIFKY